MANADGAVQEASVSVATRQNIRRHRAGENPRGRTVGELVDACRPPAPAPVSAPATPSEDRR